MDPGNGIDRLPQNQSDRITHRSRITMALNFPIGSPAFFFSEGPKIFLHLNFDDLKKSRHSGENRSPES
jgi:hypothetical protein